MSYFPPYIDTDGMHVPTYAERMEKLIADYKSIHGEDVYLGEGTIDYQLLSIFARCLDDHSTALIESYNARNPDYATGDSLDILLGINGLRRLAATKSKVTLTLSGAASTVIPAGSQAIDNNGYLWTFDEGCTLDSNGAGSVTATCETAGNIVAPIGTIAGIYTPIVGWTSVNNAVAGLGGTNTETDDEARLRRSKSVAPQNNGVFDSIIRALFEVAGVSKVKLLVNESGSTDANGIPGHSICALILGGDADSLAEALWKSKAPGVGTYGSTTKTYIDSHGNSNTVKFSRPTAVTVSVTVTITALDGYDEDRVKSKIKNAIVDDISALEIGESWRVSFAFRDIYNAFKDESVPFIVDSVSAAAGGQTQTTEVPCDFDEMLSTASDGGNISIVVNS